MPRLRPKKLPRKATATIYFRHAKNEKGNRQICTYAVCDLSGYVCGPIWSHSEQAIKKAVSDLTRKCDCPAEFHKPREFVGVRVSKKKG